MLRSIKRYTYFKVFRIKFIRQGGKMLNYLWPAFIIISFIYGFLSGNIEKVNNSIFEGAANAVELSISLLRNNMFMEWNNGNSN